MRLLTSRSYLRAYYRGIYRGKEQAEWGFLLDWVLGKLVSAERERLAPPTARAFRKAIDETRPDVVCALHSFDVGGAYMITSENLRELYLPVKEVVNHLGIPIQSAPELPEMAKFSDGVFEMPDSIKMAEWRFELGMEVPETEMTYASR